MNFYQIENTASGVILGTYKAETEAAALDLMAQEAGYRDYAEANIVAPAEQAEIAITMVNRTPIASYRALVDWQNDYYDRMAAGDVE